MISRSLTHYKRSLEFLGAGSSTLSKVYRSEEEPIVIEKGRGCRVWNLDGREFIDFRNGLGPVTLGYCVPQVNAAIARQLKKGLVYGHPHRLEGEAAEKLCAVIPCAEKMRFLKTGGEAAAACIKIARAPTGRDYIIHCGYNGWLNSLATGGQAPLAIAEKSPLRGIPSGIAHYHRMLDWGNISQWEQVINAEHESIAAVVIATNYQHFDKGHEFLLAIRRLTEKYGILMIMDEIVTGFRIAMGGAGEYFGFKPDLAVFAKGIANGMPISLYVGRRDLIDISKEIGISSTYGGEALSLAAVSTVVDFYRKHDVIGGLKKSGEYFWSNADSLFTEKKLPVRMAGHPACKMFIFEKPEYRDRFMQASYQNGLSFYDVSYINYSHRKKDLDQALVCLGKAASSLAAAQ